eukprot:TRINITY_DN796_c1_g8_i1.p1 TRINITY_DN796_c1_g8~~TRINITY_DN796_c1_g8_i1.p1  ORF type:complete len:324 (-),score=179.25 TRINITY_DN796_c1_g8_i1:844-1815(-)
MALNNSALDQLRQFTTVVADTGDFEQISKYKPQDATTNPSLLLIASQMPQYSTLLQDAINYAKSESSDINKQTEIALDKLAVNFGTEILKIIPGRVSTEIDARFSFDSEKTIQKARQIVQLYKNAGIDSEKRLLIKIASTWEGLQAAGQLEKEGIHCNLTLLFSFAQACVAAELGVTLISPFAGRITDFYKAKEKRDHFPPHEDPGVLSIQKIYNYYKKYGYNTIVMGASFRTKEQIIELAGCDCLTVSPQLLEELAKTEIPIERKLNVGGHCDIPKQVLTQSQFLWQMNDDEMAHFKLAEGIRKFAQDTEKLETTIRKILTA